MSFTIRPVRVPEDFGRMVDLFNSVNPEPITLEQMHEWEAKRPEGLIEERVVAVDENGYVVGFANADRVPWMNPGKFEIGAVVDPAYYGKSIGGALYKHVETWALEQGATLLESWIRDHLDQAVEFAKRRGFELDRHIFDSKLDVSTFDESRFDGVIEKAQASGVRFVSLAEKPGEETERKIYEVVKRSFMDIPGYDEQNFAPFEQWHKWALEGKGFRADCVIFAEIGDEIAGVSYMKHIEEKNILWTHYTGVHPDFRGRNLALAMKLFCVRVAREIGAPYMRTNNDSKNAPMLAVNIKMGYERCPGSFRMRKAVPAAK